MILIFSIAARAQTWDGGGTDDNLSTANNWNPNAVPANNGTANLAFAGVTRLTPVVNVNFDVNSVAFNNTAGAFSIGQSGGSVLTVRGGGIVNNDVDIQTLATSVTFASGSSITAPSGALNFIGIVNLGANTITVSGDFNTDFDVVTGAGGLVKNGNGTLNLASSGTQDYDITVNSGTVDFDSAMTFSSSSTITVNGGTLDLSSTTLNGAILTRSATGALTGGSLTAQSGATVIISGAFTTPAALLYTVDDSGSTFTSGDFDLNNSATFRVLGGADATITNDFDVASDGTAGTLLVNGAGSTLAIAASTPTLGFNGPATVTFSDGATGSFPNTSVRIAQGAGSSATVLVSGGAQVTAGTFQVATFNSSGPAAVTVTGAGSRLITTFNVAAFEIGDPAGTNEGTNQAVVNAENGGELDLAGPLLIEKSGTLNLNGGIVTFNFNQPLINNGTLNFNSGRVNLGQNLGVAGPSNNLFGANLILGPGREIIVPSSRPTTVGVGGALVLNGGLLQTGTLTNNGGTIEFLRGTLRITGSAGLSISSSGPLGGNVTIPTGATLDVTSATTMVANDAILFVDGGSFSTFSLANNGSTIVASGTASTIVTANNSGAQLFVERNLSTSSALDNASGATLELINGTGRLLGAGALRNSGLLTGSGTILKPVTNAATGEIRAEKGKTLLFSGSFSPNNGELNLQGGTLDFVGTITNAAGGFIAGRGALYMGGLTNAGQLAFSGGNADLHGDVTLTPGSRVVTAGAGAVTTFFDDVVHNGLEVFTGTGASTVFFGGVTGAGPFTGTGTVYFIGDLRPGTSPANLSFGGDLVFGSFARTVIEIGGVLPGTQHDRLSVAHTLYLGGVLEIQLVNSFIPSVGQSFKILDATTINGSFSGVTLPPLLAGRFWNTDSLATAGVLSVVGAPTLNYTNNSPNLGFSWSGDFKLQAQTNGLNVGISSNWADYPGGGSSPVSVPIDVLRGAVFFRLSSP